MESVKISIANPPKFKKGDRVRCIKNVFREGDLVLGEEYTVLVGDRSPNIVTITLLSKGNKRIEAFPGRFELIPKPKEPILKEDLFTL